MHGNFLTLKDSKMSKSKGGILTISELEKKGFEPLVYRYFCLTTHYRKRLIFSIKNLESAKTSYLRLKNSIAETQEDKTLNKPYLKEFEEAINNDLDMPNALQVLWKLIRDKNAKGKIQTIKEIDKVLGLKLLEKDNFEIPKEIQKLVEERETARAEKDWAKSDELRNKINESGYQIDDTGDGTKIKKL